MSKGTATITVTCGSFSDTCAITVTAFYDDPVLGYVLSQNNRIDYRSAYNYIRGGTFNDPFLKKISSGQTIKVRRTNSPVSGLYLYMYVYDTGTFTDKCTQVGDDYVLTQAMLDMQDNNTYGILRDTTLLHTEQGWASAWDDGSKDYTATQDCYVAFWYNIDGSDDISANLDAIKNGLKVEVE